MGFKSVIFGLLVCLVCFGGCLELKNRAYEGLTIKVSEAVPAENCKVVLENLQVSFTI